MENRQFEAQVFCGKAFKINGRDYNVSENPKNVVLNADGSVTLVLFDNAEHAVPGAKGTMVRNVMGDKKITFAKDGSYTFDGVQYDGKDEVGQKYHRIMRSAIRENFYSGKLEGVKNAQAYSNQNMDGRSF